MPSIRDVVAKVDFFLKNKFAAVVAGRDGGRITRVLRTNPNGELIIAAGVTLLGSPSLEIVNIDNGNVLLGNTTVQTEFIITQPVIPPPAATKRFTVGMTLAVGNGNILIQARTGPLGAWQTLVTIPIGAGGVADLSYIPTWPRYRVFYQATINSTGVYLMVMTHPML